MKVVSLVKSPAETMIHTLDLGGRAEQIGAVEVEPRGLVAGALAVVATVELEAGNARFEIAGGSDGEIYAIGAIATLWNGAEQQLPIELAVIDGDWTMPDGGVPMLSLGDFVARVGRDEILRQTDMGDGRIDKGLVIGALRDAQAQAEANLAGRYALPFGTVPTLVEGIVSDLARAGLYVDDLPKNVEERRKIALRNLDLIRKGELTLGAEALPQTVRPVDPVRVRHGDRAYPDGLAEYRWR